MRTQKVVKTLAVILLLAASSASAGEWNNWRGPHFTGVSGDTGLISSWSQDGENLIWRADFVGRSTAAVFDGRACAIGRDGAEILRQEVVVCWSAEDGTKLWERRFTPHNTYVPWQRLGWASVAGDSETGYLYANTSDGVLIALDKDGETVWQYRTAEDFGRLSGYGGRTHTPILDEDRLVVAMIQSSWGDQGGPASMRYWAFDKKTGEVLFAAKPSPRTRDANTQSTPVVAVVNGERLLIGASSDGSVYAVRARTGETLWSHEVSQVSLNAGVAVADGRVFASHSEENIDTGTMGRMIGDRLRSASEGGIAKPRPGASTDHQRRLRHAPGPWRPGLPDRQLGQPPRHRRRHRRDQVGAQHRHRRQERPGVGRRQDLRHRGQRQIPHPERCRRPRRGARHRRDHDARRPSARPRSTPRRRSPTVVSTSPPRTASSASATSPRPSKPRRASRSTGARSPRWQTLKPALDPGGAGRGCHHHRPKARLPRPRVRRQPATPWARCRPPSWSPSTASTARSRLKPAR